MKRIILQVIDFYQKFISIALKNLLGVNSFCRYSPTCSQYAKNSILKHGVFKGGYMSIRRVLSCQPVQIKSSKFRMLNYLSKFKVLTFNFKP